MKVNNKTLAFLAELIAGDNESSVHRTGSNLVKFFNKLGFNDRYGPGFPTRSNYTYDRLDVLNKAGRINEAIELYLNPIEWIEREEMLSNIVEKLNEYLKYDKYKVQIEGEKVIIKNEDAQLVEPSMVKESRHEEILNLIGKCKERIEKGDYEGAVTIARSLLETTLLYVYKEETGKEYNYKGELKSLFTATMKDALRILIDKETQENFRKIISGLHTIVHGITPISSVLGDRHGKIKPINIPEAYAILVCNAAITLSEFIMARPGYLEIS